LVGGPLLCLAAGAAHADTTPGAARAVIQAGPAIDLHSHAGGIASASRIRNAGPFGQVAQPMRTGGMAVVCLAVVSDGPTHRVMEDGRIHPFRQPQPNELYAFGQRAFGQVLDWRETRA
jgi:membrane dipeptidase